MHTYIEIQKLIETDMLVPFEISLYRWIFEIGLLLHIRAATLTVVATGKHYYFYVQDSQLLKKKMCLNKLEFTQKHLFSYLFFIRANRGLNNRKVEIRKENFYHTYKLLLPF